MFSCIDCTTGKTSESRRNLLKRIATVNDRERSTDISGHITSVAERPEHETMDPMETMEHLLSPDTFTNLVPIVSAILKRLKKSDLASLETTIEYGNLEESECVLLIVDQPETRDLIDFESDVRQSRAFQGARVDLGNKLGVVDPVYAVCRAWRWNNLTNSSFLRSLGGFCSHPWTPQHGINGDGSPSRVCINPYHWGLLAEDAADIKSNQRVVQLLERLKTGCSDNDNNVKNQKKRLSYLSGRSDNLFQVQPALSNSSGGYDSGDVIKSSSSSSATGETNAVPWGLVSYWEMLHHMRNSWLPVSSPVYHVFSSHQTGNGLWLPDLQGASGWPSDSKSSAHSPNSRCIACGKLTAGSRSRKVEDWAFSAHNVRSGFDNNNYCSSSGGDWSSGESNVLYSATPKLKLEGVYCSSCAPICYSGGSGFWVTSPSEKRQIQRCREKIGAGISLFREEIVSNCETLSGSRVWLYNRSDQPIFVSSPTLLPSDVWSDKEPARVVRLQPGYLTVVFDSIVYDVLEQTAEHDRLTRKDRSETDTCSTSDSGAGDMYKPARTQCLNSRLPSRPGESMNRRVIHVSFGKGWGSGYRRQDVTSCPCRLEILLGDEQQHLKKELSS